MEKVVKQKSRLSLLRNVLGLLLGKQLFLVSSEGTPRIVQRTVFEYRPDSPLPEYTSFYFSETERCVSPPPKRIYRRQTQSPLEHR